MKRNPSVVVCSLLAHAGLVSLFLLRPTVHVREPLRPGTPHGTQFSLTYLPAMGPASAHPVRAAAVRPQPPRPAKMTARLTAPPQPKPEAPAAAGAGSVDALGDGDVTVAFVQYFPDPKPDLSALPPGGRGDVILEATISADGRIADLQLKQGLGRGIDDVVVATVEQWKFQPATRDGKPVASQQELHFHYERA